MKGLKYILYILLACVVVLISVWFYVGRDSAGDRAVDPDFPSRLHLKLGEAMRHIDQGRLNEAFVMLNEAESELDSVAPEVVRNMVPARDLYLLTIHKANIFTNYHDFRSAGKCYRQSLSHSRSASDSMRILFNIAAVACHYGDSADAREALRTLDGISLTEAPDIAYRRYAKAVSAAYIEKFFGDREKSREWFEQSLAIAIRDSLDRYFMLTPVSELYEWFASVDSLDKTLGYLEDYKRLAAQFHMPEMMADVEKGFIRAYILRGDRDKALSAFDSYFTVVDSLYDPTRFTALNSKYKEETLLLTSDRMMKLELTLSRQKIVMTAILILLIVGLAGYFIVRSIRQSKRRIFFLNREIARQEQQSNPIEPAPEGNRNDSLMQTVNSILSDPAVFCDPDFTISTLATLAGSNTKYISQAINETTGMNFRMFINSLRVRVARSRLSGKGEYAGMTIQAISESVGFKSTSNFVIAFRKIMGITPSAYRKLANNSD